MRVFCELFRRFRSLPKDRPFRPMTSEEHQRQITQALQMSREASPISDLLGTLRRARPIRALRRLLLYLRRIRLIALILRLVGLLLAFVQAGTFVLLTTLLLSLLLPLLLVFSAILLLVALIDTRRSRKRILSLTKGLRIHLYFSPSGNAKLSLLRELAKKEGCAVLVVSPYWISGEGLGRIRLYTNVRRDGERLFLIRRYFFLSIRSSLPSDSVWIY